jgi:AcrR family transcriptional regulator
MGRRPLLDRAGVLDAALALADESGLGAVTMHAVATRLGVTPMALYRHVGDKAALLDGLVERLLGEVELPPVELTWADRLVAMARDLRRTGQRHPAVFPLLLARPAATDEAARVRDAVLRTLAEMGWESEEVAQTERLVSTAVLGFTVSEVSGRFRNHPQSVIDADFERLLMLLRGFVEPRTPGSGPAAQFG